MLIIRNQSKTRLFTRALSSITNPLQKYNQLIASNDIREDAAQRVALKHLDHLFSEVIDYQPKIEEKYTIKEETNKSWFSFNEKPNENKILNTPRGCYLHSGPGSGKTFIMDLFFDCLPSDVRKKRQHFNEFMLEIHRTLHNLQKNGISGDQMMDQCVDELFNDAYVLCFDEFQVTDIADAMVMRRLFHKLFEKGLVMVATSNRDPDELYKNGLQRDLFLPFIEELKQTTKIINMQSEVDYRMVLMEESIDKNTSPVFMTVDKNNLKEKARFFRLWDKLTKGDVVDDLSLSVQGNRQLKIRECARHTDVAKFSFEDLCEEPLGAADYFALACSFHTVFIENVPELSLTTINPLRRFITLIDTLYDQRVIVVISSEKDLDHLLNLGSIENEEDAADKMQMQEVDIIGTSQYMPQSSNVDEVFAFSRTLSRLREMGTSEYLETVHKGGRTEGSSAVRFLSSMNIVGQTSKEVLSKGDIRLLWDRYDVNEDGVLDKDEVNLMLQEITLFKHGHKHIPDEVKKLTMKALDKNGDGLIHWDEFYSYFTENGLNTKVRSYN